MLDFVVKRRWAVSFTAGVLIVWVFLPWNWLAARVLPEATRPTPGQHTDEVLADVLGWDATRIEASRAAGGLGGPSDH